MQIDLSKKRVLITGGTTGIGAAMARAFADAGAYVAINYLAASDDAERLFANLTESGAKTLRLMADISERAEIDDMFTEIDRAWGGIDVLVNNAGIEGEPTFGWQGDPDQWMRVIDVNLKGAYLCARQALQRMVKQHAGVVINITSVHETIAWTGHSAYVASKAGLSMMAKTLAQEAAPHGVRVLNIAPGAIRTPINEIVREDTAQHRDLLSKIPLGYIGNPEDVAGIAVMLVSNVARYITGSTVFVDGGMTDYPDFAHGG